ncbi:DUF3408 domain-containing protein [Adhaeribacter aquaticus]|uniref:DUF3408 domain-containing protein n=1 Tax=Adhaeribacter aquaticus TaxID=299567 RepID=UPI0003F896D7|nr:DUF3408 domain-containing protein [Adhaeribacter aquaticus]
MAKKGAKLDFNEQDLIGSISGFKRNKPVETPAPLPEQGRGEGTLPITEDKPTADNATGSDSSDLSGTPVPPRKDQPKPTAPVQVAAPVVVENNDQSKGEEISKDQSPVPSRPKGKLKTWEYDRFLQPTPGLKKSHSYLSDVHHGKIKKLLSILGKNIAIVDYLDNVLSEHFERFGPEIQERINNNFTNQF